MASNSVQKFNPFPGLRPFHTEEDYLFFGREDQTMELLGLLRQHRFLAVVGTSGSGKSSLVRAGMLPALHGGTMTQAGSSWEVILLRPGGDPLANLARAIVDGDLYDAEDDESLLRVKATLTRSRLGLVEAIRQSELDADTNLLIVVDQFEELFRFRQTGVEGQEVAAAFVKLLLAAARQNEQPIYVAITMRSDYLGDCAQIPGLAEAVNDGEYLIPRLSRQQRRAAIERPVSVGGGTIATRLVHKLLNDVGDDVDQLPVLQHALMRIWQHWSDDHAPDEPLDLRHYEHVGGLHQALSLHADEVFTQLPDEHHRNICAKLFKALTERGPDNRGIRRPTRLRKLGAIVHAAPDELITIIEAFRRPGVTFLMPTNDVELTPETVIDISHESLMRVWQRLDHWVEEESQSARIYQRLAETAALHAEGKAGVYYDPDLQIALSWRETAEPNEAWASRYHVAFAEAMQFLDVSSQAKQRQEAEREAARQRELEQARRLAENERLRAQEQQQAARRLQGLARALAVVALLACCAFGVAMVARRQAQQSARLAKSNEERAKASQQSAVEAAGRAERAQQSAEDALVVADQQRREADRQRELTRRNLYAAQMAIARSVAEAPRGVHRMRSLLDQWRPQPDAADLRGWEWYFLGSQFESRQTIHHLGGAPVGCALHPDGKLLAFSDSSGMIVLWDLEKNTERIRFRADDGFIADLQWSPDGSQLAAGCGSTLRVWEAETGLESLVLPNQQWIGRVDWNPDGQRLAVATPQIVSVWDIPSGSQLATYEADSSGGRPCCDWSPDGRELLIAAGTTLVIKDVARGTTRLTYTADPPLSTWAVAWHPDGEKIASGDRGGLLRLWDSQSGADLVPAQEAHQAPVSDLRWSRDGRLASTSFDGTVIVWDGVAGRREATLRGHGGYVMRVAWYPDGQGLVSCSIDQTVRIWDLGRDKSNLVGLHRAAVNSLSWSPDGRRLASAGRNDGIRIWDVSGNAQPRTLEGDQGRVRSVAWHPKGKWLAAAKTGSVEVLNVESGEQTGQLRDGWGIEQLAWDPTGRWLAGAPQGNGNLIKIWDFQNPAQPKVRVITGAPNVTSVAWSPDGSRFASASQITLESPRPQIAVWDRASGRRLAAWSIDDSTSLQSIDWSPDGARIVVAGGYSRGLTGSVPHISVWSADRGEEEFQLTGHTESVEAAVWSSDGRRLASVGRDQALKIWDAETGQEILTLAGDFGMPTAVAWSPEGTRIAVASADQSLHMYDALPAYLAEKPDSMLEPLTARIDNGSGTLDEYQIRAAIYARQGRWAEAAADLDTVAAGTSDEGPTWFEGPWWIVGPYPEDLETPFPPENEPNPLATVAAAGPPSAGGPQQLQWIPVTLDDHHGIRFEEHFSPFDHRTFYAYSRIYAPRELPVGLLLGSDDYHRLWLNGELLHEHRVARAAQPDQGAVLVTLRAGWNTVLLKIVNLGGSSGLYFRLSTDPLQIARALDSAGEHAAALEQWDQVLARDPASSLLRMQRSRSASAAGRYEEAVADVSAVLSQFPQNLSLVRHLSQLHVDAEHWDEALATQRRAVALCPNVPEVHRDLGRSLGRYAEKDIVPAGSSWKWLHLTDGSDPAANDADFYQTFHLPGFDDTTWRANEDSGGFATSGVGNDARINLGQIVYWSPVTTAYFRHRFTTDSAYTNLVLQLERDDAVIVYLDGVEIGRDNITAEEAFRAEADSNIRGAGRTASLRLDGTLEPGEHLLAISLHNQSRQNDGIRIANIALRGRPGQIGTPPVPEGAAELIARGLAFAEIRNEAAAQADFAAAAELLTVDFEQADALAEALHGLARQYEQQGDLQLAIRLLGFVLQVRPERSISLGLRGRLYGRTGQWEQAAADLAAARQLNPADPQLWYELAPLLVQTGQLDAYREHCRQLIERFAAGSPVAPGQVLEACLLLPDAVADWQTPLAAASRAVRESSSDTRLDRLATRTMLEYRAGNQATADPLRRAAGQLQGPRATAALVFRALADKDAGEDTEAAAALAEIEERLQQQAGLDRDDLGDRWSEWLAARILRREAAGIIRGSAYALVAEADDLFQDRQFAAAIDRLTDAIAASPSQPELYRRRAEAAVELGQWQRAAQDYEHAVTVNPDHEILVSILQRIDGPLQEHVSPKLALMAAAWNGDLERARQLLAAAAAAESTGPASPTQLLPLAVEAGHPQIVELLLQHGADVNFRGDRDSTPLHLAARLGHSAVVESLLAHQADVNLTDESGNTPLHAALSSFPSTDPGASVSPASRSAVVRALLRHAPDLTLQNRDGSTPLQHAQQPRPRVLSLAEVQVFSDGQNIAPHGTATQSSTDWGGVPERATDGDTNGTYWKNSVSHTATEIDPWWELDLGSVRQIDRIVIWDRTPDQYGEYRHRLANYQVQLLDESRTVIWQVQKAEDPEPADSHAPQARGRFIRVVAPSTEEGLWQLPPSQPAE